MILGIENIKVCIKTIKLINEFSEVAGYKSSVHKSVAFLFTNET